MATTSKLKGPREDTHTYITIERVTTAYSILLQGICDADRKFIDIFCVKAGFIHDARMLKKIIGL